MSASRWSKLPLQLTHEVLRLHDAPGRTRRSDARCRRPSLPQVMAPALVDIPTTEATTTNGRMSFVLTRSSEGAVPSRRPPPPAAGRDAQVGSVLLGGPMASAHRVEPRPMRVDRRRPAPAIILLLVALVATAITGTGTRGECSGRRRHVRCAWPRSTSTTGSGSTTCSTSSASRARSTRRSGGGRPAASRRTGDRRRRRRLHLRRGRATPESDYVMSSNDVVARTAAVVTGDAADHAARRRRPRPRVAASCRDDIWFVRAPDAAPAQADRRAPDARHAPLGVGVPHPPVDAVDGRRPLTIP